MEKNLVFILFFSFLKQQLRDCRTVTATKGIREMKSMPLNLQNFFIYSFTKNLLSLYLHFGKYCDSIWLYSLIFNTDIIWLTFVFLTYREIPLVFEEYRYVSPGMAGLWWVFPSLIRINELRLFMETFTLGSKRLGKLKGSIPCANSKNRSKFCWNWLWMSLATGKAEVRPVYIHVRIK